MCLEETLVSHVYSCGRVDIRETADRCNNTLLTPLHEVRPAHREFIDDVADMHVWSDGKAVLGTFTSSTDD